MGLDQGAFTGIEAPRLDPVMRRFFRILGPAGIGVGVEEARLLAERQRKAKAAA